MVSVFWQLKFEFLTKGPAVKQQGSGSQNEGNLD